MLVVLVLVHALDHSHASKESMRTVKDEIVVFRKTIMHKDEKPLSSINSEVKRAALEKTIALMEKLGHVWHEFWFSWHHGLF